MYNIFFEIIFMIYNWQPLSIVYNNNALKNKIVLDYRKNNLTDSEKKLRQIIKVSENEPELSSNLALVLYKQNKYIEAKKIYTSLQNSNNNTVAADAIFHIGLISIINKDTLSAINKFENTLKKDSKHDFARYNLELLKHQFKNNKQKSTKSSENNIDFENRKKAPKTEIDPLSEKEALLARLNKINMTESQARNIFDALGKNETKYIYQIKKKSDNTNANFQTW